MKVNRRTSLVVQWLRIHLIIQGPWVQILVQEDSICCRTAKPCTSTAEHTCPIVHALQQEKLPQWEAQALQLESSPCFPQLEKAFVQQRRPAQPKINKLKKKKKTSRGIHFIYTGLLKTNGGGGTYDHLQKRVYSEV